ncbi:MAG TPA: MMPL family transporter [bacterium]|nr:MMPL family transporter [bacterium]
MSITNSSFSIKKKNRIILALTIVFFLLISIKVGDVYYNQAVSWVASKTNNVVSLPKIEESPFHLGLDLQGGVQLTYQADVSQIADADKDDVLEGVRDVIESRINAFGVSEPLIQINKTIDNDYQIIVELAGVTSVNDAIKEIGDTPELQFKEQSTASASTTEANLALVKQYNDSLKTKIEEVYTKVKNGEDFISLAKANNTPIATATSSDVSVGTENDGDLGWISQNTNSGIYNYVKDLTVGQTTNVIETEAEYVILKLEDKKTSSSILTSNNDTSKNEYKVRSIALTKATEEDLADANYEWANTELTGANLRNATLQFDANNSPEVSLEFDSEGAELFKEITTRNIGKPVAIYLDDLAISVPTVNEAITDGKAVISGSFTIDEAKELVQRLKAGALPVPINLINQKEVGASLGSQSIADSLKAGLIGLLLVALFMIIVYRLPGLLSVFSLLIYGVTVLTIFKALPVWLALLIALFFVGLMIYTFNEMKLLNIPITLLFLVVGVVLLVCGLNPVTLTLAGVAGFVLSIGMAVDANILIFERMKEELRSGRSLKDSINEGIRRAWPSIRDGNITTLLICLILMFFGTGTLKGFGTTLFIGVSVSMFSAVTITNVFLNLFLGKRVEKHGWLLGIKAKKDNN